MHDMPDMSTESAHAAVAREGDRCVLTVSGVWSIGNPLPSPDETIRNIEAFSAVGQIYIDARGLTGWDSGFLTFLSRIRQWCMAKNVGFHDEAVPEGVRRLLALASAVPDRQDPKKKASKESFLSVLGGKVLDLYDSAGEVIEFIGEATVAVGRFVRGKASFRKVDLVLFLEDCGAKAFPIVTLISLLVGLILAFVGAIQLKAFGAQIYVADVVGIGMVRVMGAIMTGIIMAGRTGAAFAAQLGTMQVNEEIDALKTLGISPMEFLVLPRMIALVIMMPLLCVYADLMGILGGMIVGVGMLDLNVIEYLNETRSTLTMTTFFIGLFHSAVFGVIVALAGCLRGMQAGRSASAVGYAATSAVVTSIVSIVIATAIITFVCQVLGI